MTYTSMTRRVFPCSCSKPTTIDPLYRSCTQSVIDQNRAVRILNNALGLLDKWFCWKACSPIWRLSGKRCLRTCVVIYFWLKCLFKGFTLWRRLCEFSFTLYINNITHGRDDNGFVGQRERKMPFAIHWRRLKNKNRTQLQRNGMWCERNGFNWTQIGKNDQLFRALLCTSRFHTIQRKCSVN